MSVETLPYSPEVVEESEGKTKRAYLPMYRIIMWDDNVTTMEFVIRILITLMGKEYSAAEKLMYEIHLQGSATVATMPLEQAEFKVEQVHCAAAMEEFPFTCTIEQAWLNTCRKKIYSHGINKAVLPLIKVTQFPPLLEFLYLHSEGCSIFFLA